MEIQEIISEILSEIKELVKEEKESEIERLIKDVTAAPFPADAKVRITIAGLAYCSLDKATSTINFLSHLNTHELLLVVVKRVRDSQACYPRKIYNLSTDQSVAIKLDKSTPPPSIKNMTGNYPLEEIVNLKKLHGAALVDNGTAVARTKVVTIEHCSFYTAMVHPGTFQFVENIPGPAPNPVTSEGEIGYVLGGKIALTPDINSLLTIESTDLPGNTLSLDGSLKGMEFVYDVILSNHCNDAGACKAQVNHPDGTDFKFYYDVLKDDSNPYKRFEMVAMSNEDSKLYPLSGPAPGTEEVAACNPVIIEPNEPYV